MSTHGERNRKNTLRSDQYAVGKCIEIIKDAKKRVREADNSKAEIQEKLDESLVKSNYYMDRFPRRTKYELVEHTKSLRKPGIYYFLKQFHDGTGDLHKVMNIPKCCNTIFNPLWPKDNHYRVTFINTSSFFQISRIL